MTENFLSYLWKCRLIEPIQYLASGERIEIVHPGLLNPHAGPDFFNARIRIDDTLWAGNVEIHTRSSFWVKHGHHKDKAYQNVILHVVYTDDQPVYHENGQRLPTLILESRIDTALMSVYSQIMLNRNWIPCASLIRHVPRFVIHNWLDRMVAERLERKGQEIRTKLAHNGNNWNETFYQSLARNFGFKVNAGPFEILAKSTPLSMLLKHKDNLCQLEALLFGQAGLLSSGYRNAYFLRLKTEYKFLASKYKLQPMEAHLWQFLRMRPSNFPTLRIAQFAGLIQQADFLFSKILELESLQELKALFSVTASADWDDRYTFKKRSPRNKKRLGMHAVQLLLINTVIPYLYMYGKIKENQVMCSRALMFMEQLPGERNAIVRGWQGLGMPVQSAYSTQALLELKSRYCQRKKCLDCGIGNSILQAVKGEEGS